MIEHNKNQGLQMSKNEPTYQSLINSSLYKEAFILLNQNLKNVEHIQKSLIVDEFLKIYLNNYNLKLINEAHSKSYILALVENMKDNQVLCDFNEKISLMINENDKNNIFKNLVLSNDNENALFVKKILNINSDLSKHVDLLIDLSAKDNYEAVNFLCQEMDNIHFNNGAFLRILSNRSIKINELLLIKYSFDLTEFSDKTNFNFLSFLIDDNLFDKFAYFINKNYEKIDFNLVYGGEDTKVLFDFIEKNSREINSIEKLSSHKGLKYKTYNKKQENSTLFDLIENSPNAIKFIESLLKQENLNVFLINKIKTILMNNPKVRSEGVNREVFKSLFSHKNFIFDNEEDRSIFFYSIINKMGNFMYYDKEKEANEYALIAQNYSACSVEKLPVGKNNHALGAMISILVEISTEKEISNFSKELLIDCMKTFLSKEPELVNTKNPNGKYPVLMTENSDIYNFLLTNEAIPRNPNTGVINFIKLFFNLYKPSVNESLIKDYFEKRKTISYVDNNDVLNASILESKFSEILNNLDSSKIDDELIEKIKNIYTKSKDIAKRIDDNNVKNLHQEIHFLKNNTPDYIKRSIDIYVNTYELNKSFGEVSEASKIEKAKKECLEQLEILNNSLDKINKNVYIYIQERIDLSAQVHNKVLQVKSSEVVEMEAGDEKIKPVPSNNSNPILLDNQSPLLQLYGYKGKSFMKENNFINNTSANKKTINKI